MENRYFSREEVVGKRVIDSNAMIVGNVKDLSFATSMTSIALNVTAKEGNDIIIESYNISAIGDVVLLKPKEQPLPTPSASSIGLCRSCGYQNNVNAKFCIKCGSKLQA